jgi:hypothetical protein
MFVLLTCALVAFMGGAGIAAMSRLQLAGIGGCWYPAQCFFQSHWENRQRPAALGAFPPG